MGTGVFNATRAYGSALQYRRRLERSRKIDQFADLLAEHDADAGEPGGNITVCATKMGITPKEGNEIMQRIRRALGPQAR